MDRSWIHGRKFTLAYTNGVKEFMEFVKERFPEHIPISCPCRHCLNQTERPQQEVNDHILIHGMSATYTRWTHHGESLDATIVEYSEQVDGSVHDDGIAVDDEPDNNDNDDGIAVDDARF